MVQDDAFQREKLPEGPVSLTGLWNHRGPLLRDQDRPWPLFIRDGQDSRTVLTLQRGEELGGESILDFAAVTNDTFKKLSPASRGACQIASPKIGFFCFVFSGLTSSKTPQPFGIAKANTHSLLIARTYLLCISKLPNARTTKQIAPGLRRKRGICFANQQPDSNPRTNIKSL